MGNGKSELLLSQFCTVPKGGGGGGWMTMGFVKEQLIRQTVDTPVPNANAGVLSACGLN